MSWPAGPQIFSSYPFPEETPQAPASHRLRLIVQDLYSDSSLRPVRMWLSWSETTTPLQTLEFPILLPEAPGYRHGVPASLGSVTEGRAWCIALSWTRDQNASSARRFHLVPSGRGEDAVVVAECQPVPSPRASASTGRAICKAQRLGRKAGTVEQHGGTHGLSEGVRM